MGLFSNLFGKKSTNFRSPMTGKMIALEDIPDPVFASGTMGTGYAVELSDGKVVAPFDGEVIACFVTGHAYGLKSNDGVEILIHIGLDTVQLKGQGFNRKVEDGQKIKQGDVLVDVDLELIKENGKSVMSPVVFTAGQKNKILKLGQSVTINEEDVLEYK